MMEKKRSVGVVISFLFISSCFTYFIFSKIITYAANKPGLSDVITSDFIKKIERSIGCRIEYMPGKSNDYGNCNSNNSTGSCSYWFMEEGKSANSSPAMLDFDIFKSNNLEEAEGEFSLRRRLIVGWAITDEGDRPLSDEGYDLNISSYRQVRKYDPGGIRATIIALINDWVFELDYEKRIDNEKIIAILNELRERVLSTKQ